MFEVNDTVYAEFSIGSKIDDRYLIDAFLGEGGQGIVVKALDTNNHDNPVVIKSLKTNVTDKWSVDKFQEERRALAKLQGATGIVKLIDKGMTAQGRKYTVLEFVDGAQLTDLVADLPNNLPRVAGLFQQIAAAIDFAHRKEIYHRDLKPDNIMVANPHTRNELVKIIDFGIAKQTVDKPLDIELTSNIVGSLYYLSPNALEGKPDPPADDIYALGMIAYTMVTGQYPVSKENFSFPRLLEMIKEINNHPPSEKNKSLSKEVDRIILKALSKDPAERYASVEVFNDELYRALIQSAAVKTQPVDLITTKKRTNTVYFIAPLLLLGFSLLLFGLWKLFDSDKTPEAALNVAAQNTNKPVDKTAEVINSNSTRNSANANRRPVKSPAPTVSPAVSPAALPAIISDPAKPKDFSFEIVKQLKNKQSAPASASESFKAGEGIRLNISPEKEGILQIFLKDNRGKIQKVLTSKIRAAQTISFPSPRWLFFDDTPGTETIYIVVSTPNSHEKITVDYLNLQSGGKTEFVTEQGSIVKIIKLNHG